MESIRQIRVRAQVPIHDSGGKKIGAVVGGVFRKDTLFGSRHMLQKPQGWALDVHSLKEAEQAGADLVSLHDCESCKTYTAPIALIRSKGIRINRGFGEQLVLVLGAWRVDGRAPQIREKKSVEPVREVQLSLL